MNNKERDSLTLVIQSNRAYLNAVLPVIESAS